MSGHLNAPRCTRALAWAVAACALLFALCGATLARAQTSSSASGLATSPTNTTQPASGAVAAMLEECVTTGAQAERAATFAGEMGAVPGTARMAMRVDVEQRGSGDTEFHTVTAPGLGVWRVSDAKVKVYKYLKQVTNLTSPASYRGLVRFRWLNAKGHVIKRAERLTGKCLQPAAPEAGEAAPTMPASAPAAVPSA